MEEVQMLEEFLKSISIVFYEALCCRIFLDSFLRQRFMNKWCNSLFVFLLAGFIWGWGCVTQFQDMYVYRTLGIVVGIFLLGTVFYLGKWYNIARESASLVGGGAYSLLSFLSPCV